MQYDSFSTRMKVYEAAETGRFFMPLLPIYARIDGRSFSKFTKEMERPFDIGMQRCMIETTKYLVEQTGARIGYTQSDEISLLIHSDTYDSQVFFNGRIFKMVSILAAMATAKFNHLALQTFPERTTKILPTFDARVYQLPNKVEAANAILWREQDATKNAISMLAQHHFSHSRLQGKSGKEMQEMLWAERGINFNDQPARFKRGTYVRRELFQVELEAEILEKIPDHMRPEGNLVTRSRVVELDMPKLGSITNRVDVLFDGVEPQVTNA